MVEPCRARHPCLLFGPLAVAADVRDCDKARTLGHRAVLLVGDAAYYNRFGFSAETQAHSACPALMIPIVCSRADSCREH